MALEIGKEIDWSLVIPSITRPVWEPPALEVLDLFEGIETSALRHSIPDLLRRAQLLDLTGEFRALCLYLDWIRQTGVTVKHFGDWGSMDWYVKLFEAVYEDSEVVYLEFRSFVRQSSMILYVTDSVGQTFEENVTAFDEFYGIHEESKDADEAGSRTSYVTANEDKAVIKTEKT